MTLPRGFALLTLAAHIRPRAAAALLLGALLACGCGKSGPKTYKVTGSVTRGGKALEVPPVVGRVRVIFDPMDEGLKNTIGKVDAVVQPDGKFTVLGNSQKGVPAGKYRIYVYQYEDFPRKELLNGAFAEGKSPLVREVTGKNDHFDIELDNPT